MPVAEVIVLTPELTRLIERGETTPAGLAAALPKDHWTLRDDVHARLEAVRACNLLVGKPDVSTQLFLMAYRVGEEAWSKLNTQQE